MLIGFIHLLSKLKPLKSMDTKVSSCAAATFYEESKSPLQHRLMLKHKTKTIREALPDQAILGVGYREEREGHFFPAIAMEPRGKARPL